MLSRCKHGLFHILLASIRTCTEFASLIPNFVDGSNSLNVVDKVSIVHIFYVSWDIFLICYLIKKSYTDVYSAIGYHNRSDTLKYSSIIIYYLSLSGVLVSAHTALFYQYLFIIVVGIF